jgi:hypothetical protein
MHSNRIWGLLVAAFCVVSTPSAVSGQGTEPGHSGATAIAKNLTADIEIDLCVDHYKGGKLDDALKDCDKAI